MDTSAIQNIDKSRLPEHIAVIMDGNGRWAQQHNQPRVFGHRNGVKAVRAVTEACAELGVNYLTLYAFSKENWKRPENEVNMLMSLFVKTVSDELSTLLDNNIKLEAIGDLSNLPVDTKSALEKAIARTASNDHMTLILALNYSSRWEITEMVRSISQHSQQGQIRTEDIDEDMISRHLSTADYPDPELMIRTSGEHRISNFLLWQLSYAELVFSDVMWPDFSKEDLYNCILQYQHRERRFGMTGDQIINS